MCNPPKNRPFRAGWFFYDATARRQGGVTGFVTGAGPGVGAAADTATRGAAPAAGL